MKNVFQKILNGLGIESARTKNISKHVLLSFFYKGGSILSSLLLVPLTLDYLDTENYGIWLTLSSFIAWFTFFDIGLGHGLRNKFAVAKINENLSLAKGYVSTAYYTIGIISMLSFLVFLIINYFIDWTLIFNTNEDLYVSLRLLMPIVFGFFCLQLIVKLITSIYLADQKHSIQGKIGFISSFSSLILVWALTQTANSSLLLFGTIFSALPVLILVFLNVIAFTKTYRDFAPAWSYFKKIYLKDIFGLGFNFFIIQISGIILFSTDNFIISNLYSPEEVVPYNIAFKYMSISKMAFIIILTPFWSSITEAYEKKDYNWIKKSMKNLSRFTVGFIVLISVMVIISPFIYKIWLGNEVFIPLSLTISMAIFFVINMIYAPYNYFLNGCGKVKIQTIISYINLFINIPLSIILAKYFNFGIHGIIMATIFCVSLYLIFSPIQYNKIINKKAKGVWNL